MTISFNEIPSDSLVPFFYIEFDNSIADEGSVLVPWHVLLIGQKIAAGTAVANTIVEISADGQADVLGGDGSVAARQAEAYRSKPGRMRMSLLFLDDDGTAVARTVTVTYTGAGDASDSESLYIGARKATVGTENLDTPEDLAGAMVLKVNAIKNVPCVASNVAGVMTLTFKNKGALANGVEVSNDYNGETDASGFTTVIADGVAGSVDPDLTTEGVVGIIGDQWFQAIGQPYQDATNIAYIDTELENRWGPTRQIGGIQYVAKNDTFANVQSWGAALNSPFTCPLNAENLPTPTEEYAAEICAEVANAANIDPARPFQTLALAHTLSPVKADRNTGEENGLLLKAGVSTFTVDAGGGVRIQRFVTSYKTSATGATDKSYRNVNTVYTLQAIRYDFRTYMQNKYPRHKLASDGNNYGAGQAIITPKVGKAEAIARFKVWERDNGWVEGLQAFKESLVCERNTGDVDRLDWLMKPNLINQFRIAGVQIQFIL